MTKATERATHNILEMVERLMERDAEAEADLEALARVTEHEAISRLQQQTAERSMALTEVMTELSFQDLTCQAIQKISKLIIEVERRILGLIEDAEPGSGANAEPGEFSGLARLDETATGQNRQDFIDQLLGKG